MIFMWQLAIEIYSCSFGVSYVTTIKKIDIRFAGKF